MTDPRAVEFGQWLERYMAAQSPPILITELARRMGVSHTTISRWISGQSRPKPDHLTTAAPVLGIPTRDLMAQAGYEIGGIGFDTPPAQLADPLAVEIDQILRGLKGRRAITFRAALDAVVAMERRGRNRSA